MDLREIIQNMYFLTNKIMNVSKQLDIPKERLSIGNVFTKESNGLGWLKINIRGLYLFQKEALWINLWEVDEVCREFEDKLNIF